ncbi:MAG: hypothetical protein HQK54_00955 [Oligoflexales bacterium]|nr:hypothetical protein [Oligoflexales bacterium]
MKIKIKIGLVTGICASIVPLTLFSLHSARMFQKKSSTGSQVTGTDNLRQKLLILTMDAHKSNTIEENRRPSEDKVELSIEKLTELSKKNILTAQELEYKKTLFQDKAIIDAISDRLKSPSLKTFLENEGKPSKFYFKETDSLSDIPFDTEIIERQRYIKFLAQALHWKENPRHNFVESKIGETILAQNIDAAESIKIRKAIVGDKIELFSQIAIINPELSNSIVSKSEGSVKKVLNWTKDHYISKGNYSIANLSEW